MDSKRISFDMNGKKVTCFFSGNDFNRFVLEKMGLKKLLAALDGKKSPLDMFEMLPPLFYAGYKAQCKVKNEPVTITYEEMEHHISSQDPSTGTNFFAEFISLFNS